MGDGWSVTVESWGEPVVTISDAALSGKSDLTAEDERLIEGCARHLLGFIGYGLPPSTFDPDDTPTTPAAPSAEAAGELPFDVCDGKEQEAFEAWARSERMDMSTHPLHWLFLNAQTNAARQGWKGAINYCRAALRAVGAGGEVEDAARGRWLREWLVRRGLLIAQRCTPDKGAEFGNYWILRRPAVIDGNMPEGHGKTEEEAIDAARARAAEGAEG